MRKIIIVLLTLLQFQIPAQKKELTLNDAIIGRYTNLRTKTLNYLSWQNDEIYTYVKDDTLWYNSLKKQHIDYVTINEINTILNRDSKNQLKYFPRYKWQNSNQLMLISRNQYTFVNLENKSIDFTIEIPKNAANTIYNKEGKYIAYTKENNLYVKLKYGEEIAVTNDNSKEIINGQSVHRNEFGVTKGIFDSPKGNFIAYYRKDESNVTNYPLVDYMTRSSEENLVKYPMAGMSSEEVTLVIYNLSSGEKTILKTEGEADHYLTNITWSPDEKSIFILELNRGQNHLSLNQYDVESGQRIKTLLEERDNRYVEPQNPIIFSKNDNNKFYYLSRNDGWLHLYQYNTDGKILKQITKGDWEITRVIGFDKKEQHVFIEATKERPVEQHIYKVNIKNGKITKLSTQKGIHYAILNEGGSALIDIWNGFDVPYQVDIINTKKNATDVIYRGNNPLNEYNLGENKLIELKGDGQNPDLFGRLILPPNFDSNKKYPVIIYVYGGPHSQLVTRGFLNSARMWQYYMASKGYIAFTLDNRGTSNRGRDFETAIHRQLGLLETDDQMRGVDYLKSLPYVDGDRIGVHGWSYGGFMTLNLMMRHPETFKVGVAGGPVVDWSMYEVMYGERYMDTPQENEEGYKETNMVNHIDSLQGKLLIIHGAQDKTVVMQHSMKFLRESVQKNKQVDFFVYPTHPHNVRGYDRIHLMQKVSNYFYDYL